ncbi:Anucleate primary sterigmata protein B [Podosphaera aphanis]|nr:Anucleate primary sterigmata protein B [Podosphaera aphanis]
MTRKHEHIADSQQSHSISAETILTKNNKTNGSLKEVDLSNASATTNGPINQAPSRDSGSSMLDPQINSSQIFNSQNGDSISDANLDPLDDTEMHRHLNDVESSFMPALSPIAVDRKKGADDTYVFDGACPPSQSNSEAPLNSVGLSTSPEIFQEAPQKKECSSILPTVATLSNPNFTIRASTLTPGELKSKLQPTVESESEISEDIGNYSNEPGESEGAVAVEDDGAESSDGQSTLRHFETQKNINSKKTSGNKSEGLLHVRKYASRRSKLLGSRPKSQHSSISSIGDSNVGLDYALQAGGAVPACGISRHSSITLSRSISLGSMASELNSENESYPGANNTSSKLRAENQKSKSNGASSPPETPRVSSRSLTAPTDTIIARHVRNVHVPEAVAKEYRSKNRVPSPGRQSNIPGPSLSRAGENLTLKEQSSTIERLSKENFDLKLKVMFLGDRLDKLSEEGVKDMISENVELKTGLATIQRDNKALKRKVKELEKQLKEEEDRPSPSQCSSNYDGSPKWIDEEASPEWEEELVYLREKVKEYDIEIEKLRSDAISRENQGRHLTEIVRKIGERRGQDTTDSGKEIDILKDLLEQETSRYGRIDEENQRLREEIHRLKTVTPTPSGIPGLNHTTNIYNITKKRKASLTRPKSSMSDRLEDRNGSVITGSTLVEGLRRESEQLRNENAELRREVGAQTSMLTSRNREKDILYQQIEDLKFTHRMGSAAGSSIMERPVSRSHHISLSQTCNGIRETNLNENEREEFENKNAELRDGINGLKIENQELQRELKSCMEDFETAVAHKKQAELMANTMREALDMAENDLLRMQSERDEALHGQEEVELLLDNVRREAANESDYLLLELDEANAAIERLQLELADTTENFNSLQSEMKKMSQALVRLEDDHTFKNKRIQALEKDLADANRESEQLEKNLVALNEKYSRTTVQQESSRGEISFLREEQENDKIKIGNLEAATKTAEQRIESMRERTRELEHKLFTERGEQEALKSKMKQEFQQQTEKLSSELSAAKNEAKRLRKKDVEAAEWKQKLIDLEDQLRTALGEIDGTRSSFLQSITKLHHELEDTVHDLDVAKKTISQKERVIKERDELLESHALEARKLADLLDKERQYHRNTKHQFETFQKTSQHTTRNLSQQETRVIELENARQHDRRKINSLENQLKDQMTERNQLLLTLWKRLSDLCGTDWMHDNSLINGRALPSLESITTMLPGFSKNILGAVKKIESLFTDFTSRINSIEKDLWKEYQTLEANLETRSKKLDQLETAARSVISIDSMDGRSEIERLREQIKSMGNEMSPTRVTRASKEIQFSGYQDGSPNSSLIGPRFKTGDRSRASTIRHHSTASAEITDAICRPRNGSDSKAEFAREHQNYYDPKWTTRLFELEEKYKAEREARILDRTAARQRLDEKSKDNEELVQEIERLKMRIHINR